MRCPPEPGGWWEMEERVTPLTVAAAADSRATLQVLLEHGANTEYRGKENQGLLNFS
jgi:ankyrin repeat protein